MTILLTIISTLLGIVSSTVPAILQYFQRTKEMEHELNIGRLKLEAAKQGYQIAVDVAGTHADVSDILSARSADDNFRASQWVEDLRAGVRPFITYCFFLIFITVKIASSFGYIDINMANTILDDTFMAVFSVITGYYFGSRATEKFTLKKQSLTPAKSSKA